MGTSMLDQLKDIHLPNSVSTFPLAIGWYILAISVTIIGSGLVYWHLKRKQQQQVIRQIYLMLDEIQNSIKQHKPEVIELSSFKEENSQQTTNSEVLAKVSILIKRVAILKFPEQKPHTLFGQRWLEFLDAAGKTANFTAGEGKHLLNAYALKPLENPDAFFKVIRDWLRTVL